eukprot:tig00000754_g3895.t1
MFSAGRGCAAATRRPLVSPGGCRTRCALVVRVTAPQESPRHCVCIVLRFGSRVSDRERHRVPLLGQLLVLSVALRVSLG